MSAAVETRGLSRHYPDDGTPVRAVDTVDLAIEEGEAVSVMGPSGCGKSTLLHLIGGLERPTAGELLLGGSGSTGCPRPPGRGCGGAASGSCFRPSTWWTS
jgi:ABC-type Fe3+/spermidine/putrescine transport system ATPase subunit